MPRRRKGCVPADTGLMPHGTVQRPVGRRSVGVREHGNTHTHIRTQTRTQKHAHTHASTETHTHAHTHTNTHAKTRAHTRKHDRTRARAHIHTCLYNLWRALVAARCVGLKRCARLHWSTRMCKRTDHAPHEQPGVIAQRQSSETSAGQHQTGIMGSAVCVLRGVAVCARWGWQCVCSVDTHLDLRAHQRYRVCQLAATLPISLMCIVFVKSRTTPCCWRFVLITSHEGLHRASTCIALHTPV